MKKKFNFNIIIIITLALTLVLGIFLLISRFASPVEDGQEMLASNERMYDESRNDDESIPMEDDLEFQNSNEHISDSSAQENTTTLSGRPEHWPLHLQDYVPDSLRLFENVEDVTGGGSGFIPQRRYVFYHIDGFISDLVASEDFVASFDLIFPYDGEHEIMPLVNFIQHFNIPREAMESALLQMHEASVGLAEWVNESMVEAQSELMATQGTDQQTRDLTEWPWYDPDADLFHEKNELPNLDIIYTFDNAIINWYYRRA